MRRIFPSMGTVASVTAPDSPRLTDALGGVEKIFNEAERRFSLYRPGSELSRIAAGTLRLGAASKEVRELYVEALSWRERTAGAFTPHRPDGVIDLNGIVKAAAMRDARDALRSAGVTSWCLNVGGDILCEGNRPGADPAAANGWTVGIVHPADRTRMLLTITLTGSRRAVATSGSAERGEHIWRGGSPRPPDYSQVTVVADDIVSADVLATAIVSGGRVSLDELCDRWPVDVLTVSPDGAMSATPGLRAALGPAT